MIPKVSPRQDVPNLHNEQPLPDNLQGLLQTEDTFVHPKPTSDGEVIDESQYSNLLKTPSTRTMMARQQPSTFQQDQLLLTQKGALGDQLPKSQRGLPHKIKQLNPFSPGEQQDTFLLSQKMTKRDHNVKPRQLSLLNNSTDDVFDDSCLNNFGYNTNKQEGISWSRESSTLSMKMNNSLVNDGPRDMRRSPTSEMSPESKTERTFYKEVGEKWSRDFTDFAGVGDGSLERDTIKSKKNMDMKSPDFSHNEMVNMKTTTESKTLSQYVPQSSKPERIATMKEKEDFATEMVDNNDRRGTGVVFKRREPRSSNKKQSKSSTGSLEFCDFSDGEQDSTV